MSWTYLDERRIKATRKTHHCYGCGTTIQIGEPAQRWAGISDGQFNTVFYHPECREAELAFNALHDYHWYDDWMLLQESMEWEDWPWLIEEHPTVARRMNITMTRYDRIKHHD